MEPADHLPRGSLLRRGEVQKEPGGTAVVPAVGKVEPAEAAGLTGDFFVHWDVIVFPADEGPAPAQEPAVGVDDLPGGQEVIGIFLQVGAQEGEKGLLTGPVLPAVCAVREAQKGLQTGGELRIQGFQL